MNILQLCDNNDEKTDLCRVLKRFDNNIVNKYKLTNISLISYDAFVLTIDILEQYENNKDFFQKVEEQNKPIIYVYHANNVPEDAGMKLLSDRYKLNFQLSDCSVLDTPNWNYKPGIDLNNEEAYSMISNTGVGQCFVKSTLQFYIYKKVKL